MITMKYDEIYIAPHLDDAVFSCGGKILMQVNRGKNVMVLSIFTGGDRARIQEEKSAAETGGFASHCMGFLDAPFRSMHYKFFLTLFGKISKKDKNIIDEVRKRLTTFLSGLEYDKCYIPLGIGEHVDHKIVYEICNEVVPSKKRLYYEDSPYCYINTLIKKRLNNIGLKDLPCPSIFNELKEIFIFYIHHPYFGKSILSRFLMGGLVIVLAPIYAIRTRFYQIKNNDTMQIAPILEDISKYDREKLNLKRSYLSQWKVLFGNVDFYRKVVTKYWADINPSKPFPTERYWLISDGGKCNAK